MRKRIIFTDLDGTLLHPLTFSYHQALEALRLLQEREIPLIFCSARTRAGQEVYRRQLGVDDPFIVENGGAIFIPKNYFPFHFDYHKVIEDYLIIELGAPQEEIRQALNKIEQEVGLSIKSLAEMTVEEVAQESGLSLEFAALAKQREYDEAFILKGGEREQRAFLEKFNQVGLSYTYGGKFYHAMRGSDKGKAVKILTELLRKKFNLIEAIGIGDNQNDLPMLAVVDIPILVQKLKKPALSQPEQGKEAEWEKINLPRLHKVEGIGPEGWRKAILEELKL